MNDALLHRLWTKAVGTEGYDKEEWKRLEAQLHRLQAILANAETTPLAEVASELAAARENVAGTAALLQESQAEVQRLQAELKDMELAASAMDRGARRAERARCAKVVYEEVLHRCGDSQDAEVARDAIRALPDEP